VYGGSGAVVTGVIVNGAVVFDAPAIARSESPADNESGWSCSAVV